MIRNLAISLAILIGGIAFASARVSQTERVILRNAVSVATPCNFAGYDQTGALVNTNLTCASAAPQSTPSPSVTSTACATSPAWSGAFPYLLSVPAGCVSAVTASGNMISSGGATPNVTITNGPTFATLTDSALTSGNCVQASTAGLLTTVAGACSTGTSGNVLLKGSSQTWQTAVLAIASVTHAYPMNDASGCTTIADVVSSGAVPLPTPTTSSTTVCGAPPIDQAGNTSVWFPGIAASGYLLIPSTVMPASGSFTITFTTKQPAWGVNGYLVGSNAQAMFCLNANANCGLEWNNFSANSSNGQPYGDAVTINGTTTNYLASEATGTTRVHFYVWDGTHSTLYINTDEIFQSSTTPGFASGNGSLGVLLNGLSQPWEGRMCCFAVFNAALTQAQRWSIVTALGQ